MHQKVGGCTLYTGDVLDVLSTFADESHAACFCDPPYGLGETPDMAELLTHWLEDKHYDTKKGFMGKSWDVVPGPAVWREIYRILRPGAILMAFGGTRTADLLSIAIRLAGFERFDEIQYLYGSGFPKSTAIDKMIDKEAGRVREVVGTIKKTPSASSDNMHDGWRRPWAEGKEKVMDITAPATDAARTWAGYGTALKPAHEPILCFRKPRKATYAQTAIEHGTGALWVDGCRVATDERPLRENNGTGKIWAGTKGSGWAVGTTTQGRWPANIILDEAAAAALDEMSGESCHKRNGQRKDGIWQSEGNGGAIAAPGDTGGASRFFYCAKASRSERERGLEGLPLQEGLGQQVISNGGTAGIGNHNPVCQRCHGSKIDRGSGVCQCERPEWKAINNSARNNHPCVKPLALCEYLARLIVPPVAYRDDARLLVPFAGSMSEVIGAMRAGWIHIDAIEMDAGYIEIGKRRIAAESADMPLFAEAA